MHLRHRRFERFAWGFCAYLLMVILFGAWVRITHAGAGCGAHWPTCNGEVIPTSPSVETMIEYTHRLTSGALGILALVLVGWATRIGGRVAWTAWVSLAFVVVEALIGAGLVLRDLVADDDSVARAIVISLHLVNTLILTGAASLTVWWSGDDRRWNAGALGAGGWLLALGLLALVVTSMTGAVTALGDTLFPVTPTEGNGLVGRVREELSPAKHFLVRLRIVHPVVAVAAAGVVFAVASWLRERPIDARTKRLATGLRHGVAMQVVLGIVNVGLAAPGWLQLAHLLLAQLVWIAAVLTTVSALSSPAPLTEGERARR